MPNSYYAWNAGYEIDIVNPSSTAGFQGTITLSYLPGMRSDFRDIRFADKYGNELKHYIESYTAFSTAKFWIKLPANDTKILMFYGNGGVTSASDAAAVFDLWDDFNTLNTSIWTVGGAGHSVSSSILTIQNSSQSGYIESKTTFAPGSLVEMRVAHQSGQRGPFGFRNISTAKAAAWQGAAGSLTTDHRFSHDGSSGAWHTDGVSRPGPTYYIYGVVHIATEPRYYVNYEFRGVNDDIYPGSVNLPIHFYAYSGEGYLKVDWVRIRKYAATEPTLTLGRKFVQSNNGFIQKHDYFEDTVSIEISTDDVIKDYFTDSININISTDFFAGQPVQITDDVAINVSLTEGPLISRNELRDYSLVSCDIQKSITDAYLQLSANFADSKVPDDDSTVKYYARPKGDSLEFSTADGVIFTTADDVVFEVEGPKHLLFWGKVIANSPSIGSYYSTLQMQAADASRNLAVQKVPWNYQVITLNDTFISWDMWIFELLATEKTGVYIDQMIDTEKPTKQFVFKPEVSRLEAIKEIAEYMGCIINTKLVDYYNELEDIHTIAPGLSVVPAADIDQPYGGFSLPSPIEFTDPDDSTIVTQPKIEGMPDEKYNMVTVYGVITSTGETTVSSVYTPSVEGGIKAREYRIQDNSIEEKGSTAEIEAIKWLLYFNAPRATVSMQFINRFDFELYQRIRFGSGFSQKLRELTNSVQLPYVVAFDPRDEVNTKHTIDVSGVPRPRWLRVSERRYHSEKNVETVELKLITDYIYSSADPFVQAPYSQYISPGYFKPVSDDSTNNTQAIVDSTIEKQLTPEVCTVLSIDEDNKTRLVQTQSGKLVTTKYG